MERITLFADILLPLRLPGYFTYRIPFALNDEIKVGQRVVVPFGKNKLYSGLVRNIHDKLPERYEIKLIGSILDKNPIVNETQFKFWEWIAAYYMCCIGEVMNAALPSALKLASETKIILNPLFDGDYSNLTEKEYLVAEALEFQKVLTLTNISNIIDRIKVMPIIKSLIEKGVVLPEEEINERFRPKKERVVLLAESFCSDVALKEIFDRLEKKAYKQLEVLMAYLSLGGFDGKKAKWLSQIEVLKKSNATTAVLNSLIDKGIFIQDEAIVSRLVDGDGTDHPDNIQLNEYQQIAFDYIQQKFKSKNTILLHGITSSGKTELYIKLANEVMQQGKQVLYLLPEIGLTEHIINRLRKYFGNKVGIYHSRFNEFERVEIWNRVSGDSPDGKKYQLILGARSALFLPYDNLGLIIVDEEHDTSYKQHEPAPRYHAKDAAIMLAKMHNSKTLLGSATPSLESWHNAQTGRFGFAQILKRYADLPLPEMRIINMRHEKRRKNVTVHFSIELLDRMEEALKNKEQIILFHNRRGFAPRVVCNVCEWIPECKNCDVMMVYHKYDNQLHCHYCGYHIPVPQECPNCGASTMKMESYGTEKIEDDLKIIFPEANIERMDLDTTRGKHAHYNIIKNFETKKTDILIGTQMVTKGLDFSNVSLVGIINADQLLAYPDFRSFERGFQTIAQVSGRSGRSGKQGVVVIQTSMPNHPVINYAAKNLFLELYNNQLTERKEYNYPPFIRLIRITLKHTESSKIDPASDFFAKTLKEKLGKRVLGPEYPLIARINNYYLKDIMVKIEPTASIKYVKSIISESEKLLLQQANYKQVRVIIDIDPY